jgi:hypothetical protein
MTRVVGSKAVQVAPDVWESKPVYAGETGAVAEMPDTWTPHPPITGTREVPPDLRRMRSGFWICQDCRRRVPYVDEHHSAEDGGCCESFRSDEGRHPQISRAYLRHLDSRGNDAGPRYCLPPASVGMTLADDGVWEYLGPVPTTTASANKKR